MLEVCFGDSVKGALKIAQSKGKVIGGSSAIAVIGGEGLSSEEREKLIREHEERQRELDEQAVPLGGTKDDLVGIFPCLSMGDISTEDGQKALIFKIISDDEEAEKYWQICVSDFEKLKERSSKGEAVRIWADSTPDGACGFLYVCDLLKASDCPVSVVKLPEEVKRSDGTVIRYRGWGEVEPQLFGRYAEEYSVPLSKENIQKCAEEWRRLQAENSPLRTIKDRKVISVGEDYYDDIIRGEFPEKSCRIAEIIGNVLGKHRLAVSDFLIAERIREFIARGELKVVEENKERFYSAVVERG